MHAHRVVAHSSVARAGLFGHHLVRSRREARHGRVRRLAGKGQLVPPDPRLLAVPRLGAVLHRAVRAPVLDQRRRRLERNGYIIWKNHHAGVVAENKAVLPQPRMPVRLERGWV